MTNSRRLETIRSAHAYFQKNVTTMLKHGVNVDGVRLNPPCRAGCSACCYEPVYAERREAELAVEAMKSMPPERQVEIKALLREWVDKIKESGLLKINQPNVLLYRKLRVPCPFLKDNLCTIYESRPFGCRAHIALHPKEFCDDDAKRLQQKYIVFPDPFNLEMSFRMMEDDGIVEMEHFGILLAELLLGEKLEGADRIMFVTRDAGHELFPTSQKAPFLSNTPPPEGENDKA